MATLVRDTKAGKSVSAWVVLNKKGELVATVNSHYSDGGRVTVDVWNHGDKAAERCYIAAMATLKPEARAAATAKAERDALAKFDWRREEDRTNWAAHDLFGLQQSSAGGYGYDKLAAALSGLWIDGHQIADHCGTVANAQKAKERLMKSYIKWVEDKSPKHGDHKDWGIKASKLGAHFANWSSEKNRYTSLHFIAGLERLERLGYRVIQAI